MSNSLQPVLEFRGVRLAAQPPYDCGLTDVDFTLRASDLLLVEVGSEEGRTPLADLACGVLEPEAGAVWYQGRDWVTCPPDDAAAARGGIGRVFEAGGWISNLDLDENITLASRYHGRVPPAQALREAEELSRALGQAELLRARPALIHRNELRRSQWIRALLGPPALLLLERPTQELPAAWRTPLFEQVKRVRAGGTAVLWITSDLRPEECAQLRPTLHFRLRETRLQPVS